MKKSSVYGQSFAKFSTRLKGGDQAKRKREEKQVETTASDEGELDSDLHDTFAPSSEEDERHREKGKDRQQ
ncbi:MAG: hypothetical protein CYPHOPRED_005077, partial [Cyphobasidiales sp. Tagirdzhanova-0007]